MLAVDVGREVKFVALWIGEKWRSLSMSPGMLSADILFWGRPCRFVCLLPDFQNCGGVLGYYNQEGIQEVDTQNASGFTTCSQLYC